MLPALLATARTSCGCQLTSLTTRHASLEDVFVKLAGRHLDDAEAHRCMKTTPQLQHVTTLLAARASSMLARLREFYREPEAVFWVYGFPILLVVGLGIAFRNQPVERITVDVEEGPRAEAVGRKSLEQQREVRGHASSRPKKRGCDLRTGQHGAGRRSASTSSAPSYEYPFDPSRPESVLARNAVDDALQRAAGRQDVAQVTDRRIRRARRTLHRLSRAGPAGHEPDGRRAVGRRLRDRRHADSQAAQAVSGHADARRATSWPAS